MSTARRLLPLPLVTLAIVTLWMSLASRPSFGNLLLAIAIGLAVPLLTERFWPHRARLARPALILPLLVRVLADIVVSSWQVARIVVAPLDGLRPGFVTVPLAVHDPYVATLLGSIVSLTPGTVAVDIDEERHTLLVHALHIDDEAELIATIKARYEAPLKEIFGC